MAKTAFSAKKHDKSTLNSGNQYTKDDQMSIEALNNTIENSLYAVEKADTAVTSSNSAVSTANSANTKATNAVNTANTASTNANDAKTKSESALATANTALSKSTEAVTTANSAISTANSANTKADNAVATANSANTKADNAVATSDEAKRIAQEALNTSTEGVGSQVTVGGEVVGVFNADTKLDKTANAVSATKATQDGDGKVIKNTYTKLDGSNYYVKLSQPSDNGGAIGFRHIATCNIGDWSHKALSLIVKSRHSGTGLLTIGIATHGSLTNNLVGSIRFYGSTDATIKTNSWKMICDTTSGNVNVYWRYWDGDSCEIKVLDNNGFTTLWNDGEWLTTEPTAGGNQVEYLTLSYDEEYLPLTGGTLTNTLTVNAPSGKSMFYRANNDTPLIIKGGTTGSFIEYQDKTGQLGHLGVSTAKNPVFNDGSNHALSMLDKNETFSGLKTFSTAPHFTTGIVRYSKASDIDISTLSTNKTNLYQYEDFVDKNNKRVGVIGSRQAVANTSKGLPAGYGVYLQAGNVQSLAAMTDGSKFWAECGGDFHISGALYFD